MSFHLDPLCPRSSLKAFCGQTSERSSKLWVFSFRNPLRMSKISPVREMLSCRHVFLRHNAAHPSRPFDDQGHQLTSSSDSMYRNTFQPPHHSEACEILIHPSEQKKQSRRTEALKHLFFLKHRSTKRPHHTTPANSRFHFLHFISAQMMAAGFEYIYDKQTSVSFH